MYLTLDKNEFNHVTGELHHKLKNTNYNKATLSKVKCDYIVLVENGTTYFQVDDYNLEKVVKYVANEKGYRYE